MRVVRPQATAPARHLCSAMPVNQLEYFLQGSIEEKSVNTLLDRLKGLCDNAPERHGKFSELESVFSLGKACISFCI